MNKSLTQTWPIWHALWALSLQHSIARTDECSLVVAMSCQDCPLLPVAQHPRAALKSWTFPHMNRQSYPSFFSSSISFLQITLFLNLAQVLYCCLQLEVSGKTLLDWLIWGDQMENASSPKWMDTCQGDHQWANGKELSLNILDLAVLLVLGIVVFSPKLSHVIEDGNVNKGEEKIS